MIWIVLAVVFALLFVVTLFILLSFILWRKRAFARVQILFGNMLHAFERTAMSQMDQIAIFQKFFERIGQAFEKDNDFVSYDNDFRDLMIRSELIWIKMIDLHTNVKFVHRHSLTVSTLQEIINGITSASNEWYEFLPNIQKMVNSFADDYIDARNEIKGRLAERMRLIYHLGKTLPIISDLSQVSNNFSREMILDVINQFDEISDFSKELSIGIEKTMNALMDEDREGSLAFMVKNVHSLLEDFNHFVQSMDALTDVSNHFVDTSIEKLKGVSEIVDSIEEIAETIKVISLNVSIEAVNTGSAGKGFQVLARDLRNFAGRTMRFAQEVKTTVKETISSTENLKGDYVENMDRVKSYLENINASLNSFERVVNSSFKEISDIIGIVHNFSGKIDSDLKKIVGKLQTYDITSQEVEHIAKLIQKVFDSIKSEGEEARATMLSSEIRTQIKTEILNDFREFMTTANERIIFERYEEAFSVFLDKSVSKEEIAELEKNGTVEEEGFLMF